MEVQCVEPSQATGRSDRLSGLNYSDGQQETPKTPRSSERSSPEITGDVCHCGQIVGNLWAERRHKWTRKAVYVQAPTDLRVAALRIEG
jgi:hypothetical protein